MSYNTVEEASAYISTHYTSTEQLRVKWEESTPEDQQVLLNKAYDVINRLPLRGCKTDPESDAAFPRCGSSEVPLAVKSAEAELALAYSDTEHIAAVQEYRQKLDYGITSYSVGNFSESLLSYGKTSLPIQYGLISTIAESLLKPWLTGGFCIE